MSAIVHLFCSIGKCGDKGESDWIRSSAVSFLSFFILFCTFEFDPPPLLSLNSLTSPEDFLNPKTVCILLTVSDDAPFAVSG
jgi:hypothetical protein